MITLFPCYLIHGGEPQQTEEIISDLTHLATKNGYNRRVVFEVNASCKWEEELLNKCQNLDLFAERTLMELRLHGDSLNKQGTEIIEQVLRNQDANFCIIIRANKLKTTTLNCSWVKQIQQKGKVYAAKPIPSHAWLAWVTKRLSTAGFKPSKEALELIAQCYEGNLLACAQFIQKLAGAMPIGTLSLEQVKPFIDSNTQFSIFELTNAAFNGDAVRTVHIINSLKNYNVEPILVLWALTREIRNRLLAQPGKQKHLLQMAKSIDFAIKGMQPGNVWEELLAMCLIISGKETLTMEDLYI